MHYYKGNPSTLPCICIFPSLDWHHHHWSLPKMGNPGWKCNLWGLWTKELRKTKPEVNPQTNVGLASIGLMFHDFYPRNLDVLPKHCNSRKLTVEKWRLIGFPSLKNQRIIYLPSVNQCFGMPQSRNTPWKIKVKPTNHPFRRKKDRNQTFMIVFHVNLQTSWWFQPHWKICSSNLTNSPK